LRDDRPDLPGANCWSTIGGAVERGETPEQAAHREAEEEIGRSPEKLIPIGTFDGSRFRSHLFATSAVWPLDDLIVGERQGVDWLSPAAVRAAPLAKGIGPAVTEFLGSATYRALAAGGPPGPAIALPPFLPSFALELGLRPGQLVAVQGATAAFVRRLWDVLDGARVTASMADAERADLVLWWPRADIDKEALATWRRRLATGGAIWCVTGRDAPEMDPRARRLLLAARGLGLVEAGMLVLPTGERALRLAPVAPA